MERRHWLCLAESLSQAAALPLTCMCDLERATSRTVKSHFCRDFTLLKP